MAKLALFLVCVALAVVQLFAGDIDVIHHHTYHGLDGVSARYFRLYHPYYGHGGYGYGGYGHPGYGYGGYGHPEYGYGGYGHPGYGYGGGYGYPVHDGYGYGYH
ncbi:uncharacterized protein LOC143247120 [Tachypleus tridentatus]|uniref:uncharacterized protein LOC143247120 n=1 Tax=Tachypleus tridentatus TaxID=6853 RepID=UPI003FD5A561